MLYGGPFEARVVGYNVFSLVNNTERCVLKAYFPVYAAIISVFSFQHFDFKLNSPFFLPYHYVLSIFRSSETRTRTAQYKFCYGSVHLLHLMGPPHSGGSR